MTSGPCEPSRDTGHFCLFALTANGREVMDWFSRKTSIAGTQVSNWILVLAAVVIIVVIYIFMR
jgi:hypothetical protein